MEYFFNSPLVSAQTIHHCRGGLICPPKCIGNFNCPPIIMTSMATSKLHNYYYAALVIFAVLICTYYQEIFIYQRQSLEQGQLWRLFSGHFVHLNDKHLILNLIAWVIVFFLGVNYLSPSRWIVLLLILMLSISAGLYYFVPEILYYGGLSGILHGYFAYILVEWIKNKQRLSWIILLLLIAKVLAENFSDMGSSTTEYLELRVVTEAHLIGILVGIIGALFPSHPPNHQ